MESSNIIHKKSRKKKNNKERNKKIRALFIVLAIILTASFIIIGVLYQHIMSGRVITKNKEESQINMENIDKKDIVFNDYSILKDVIFFGDSYTYLISEYINGDFKIYGEKGHTLRELYKISKQVAKNNEKYVSIFIGPNDMIYKTSLENFKNDLSYICEAFTNTGKTVIVSSYLKSEFTESIMMAYEDSLTVTDYDIAIRDVCDEKGLIYFDVKAINDYVHDKAYEENGAYDSLHFNKNFYIKYMNKLCNLIYNIKKEEVK